MRYAPPHCEGLLSWGQAMKAVWLFLVVLLVVLILNPMHLGENHQAAITLPPFQPNARAQAMPNYPMGGAPGALVCDDLPTVQLMVSMYSEYWSDAMQEKIMGPKVKELRGPSAPMPQPDLFRCSLLPPGTAVEIKGWVIQGVPEVIAQRPDGKWIYGVTLESMLSK